VRQERNTAPADPHAPGVATSERSVRDTPGFCAALDGGKLWRPRPGRHPTPGTNPFMAPHRGVLILVLGILGLVLMCPLLAPMAWIMGKADIDEIDAGRMDPEGRGLTQAGMVLGIAATLLIILVLVILVGILAVGILAAQS